MSKLPLAPIYDWEADGLFEAEVIDSPWHNDDEEGEYHEVEVAEAAYSIFCNAHGSREEAIEFLDLLRAVWVGAI